MSIHTCSYYCDRPECIRAQRDELRQKFEQAESLDKLVAENQRLGLYDAPVLKEKNCSATNIS